MRGEARIVYVGCGDWNGETGKIRVYAFDRSAARLELTQELAAGGVAAYMVRSRDGSTMYVADETRARLTSYRVEPRSGHLSLLNQVDAAGNPVYVALHPSGRYLATCFFAEGKTEIFAVEPDGRLGASLCCVASGAESHCTVFDPSGRQLFVPARGAGWVAQYRFDVERGRLSPGEPEHVAELPGAGPRHLVFHPSGRFAYLLCELTRTLSSYELASGEAGLSPIEQGVPAAMAGAEGGSAADLHVHPSGRFLYASNRQGERSSVAIFSIDGETGRAALVGHELSRGRTPRNFDIDGVGKWLIVGNRESPNVSIFEVEQGGARLGHRGTLEVPRGPFFVGIH